MRRISAVALITIMNIEIYLLWFFLLASGHNSSFMFQNFLVSWTGIFEGRVWILVTSIFSHIHLLHLFLNMYVLNSFGPILERLIGTKPFIIFYLVAGIVSSLVHAFVSFFLLHSADLPALGASGAISGLIMLYSLLFPNQILLILGIIPVRAIYGALLFMGLDLWGLIVQTEGRGLPIGHGAHLGGAICGIFYYLLRRNYV
jgi:membrane associated rhomboid family serine protease